MSLDPETIMVALPRIRNWIDSTLSQYEAKAQSIEDFGFERLKQYFSEKTLNETKVIPNDTLPFPQLNKMGLAGFDEMEKMDGDGIAYPNRFFIVESRISEEPLFFHELVHIAQWRTLGTDRFIIAYALGHLLDNGYDNNPFEKIAYSLQDRFETSHAPFDAEKLTIKNLHDIELKILSRIGGHWPI